jgi:hypothetical protein
MFVLFVMMSFAFGFVLRCVWAYEWMAKVPQYKLGNKVLLLGIFRVHDCLMVVVLL